MALDLRLDTFTWGHTVFELLDWLLNTARPDGGLLDKASFLDRFYNPQRDADLLNQS